MPLPHSMATNTPQSMLIKTPDAREKQPQASKVAPMSKDDRTRHFSELRSELREVLARQSIQKGDFTLASGAKSNYYCDTKATVLSPRGARLTGEVLFEVLRGKGIEAVGGLAMGAVYLATAVALVSDEHGEPIRGFTVRESQKTHGTKKSIEASFHPDGPLMSPGRRVAVVDDVVTQGGSILKAIDAIQAAGCEIAAVIALVDRNAGGGEKIRALGLPYAYVFQTDTDGNLHIHGAEGARESGGAPGQGRLPGQRSGTGS